jgi:hypothetical protein
MIPIAPTVFWEPLAYSIMGGLAVATMLTLYLRALEVSGLEVNACTLVGKRTQDVDRHLYVPRVMPLLELL